MDFDCPKDYFLLFFDISISQILIYKFVTGSMARIFYFDYLIDIFQFVEIQTLSQDGVIDFLH